MRFGRSGSFVGAITLLCSGVLHAQGLSTFHAQMWDQELLQVPDDAEEGDQLGRSVATGDFNGDGFDDLAIGVPGEDLVVAAGEMVNAGAVLVVYGAGGGLGLSGAQFWHQDTPGIADEVEGAERFGGTLASGNFNDDAYDDLAIGAPDESEGNTDVGVVHVLYGTVLGLSATGDQIWSRCDPEILGGCSTGDHFGGSLAAGNFNGDAYQDLAIGVPMSGGFPHPGGVNVLFGSSVGLTADGNQQFDAGDFGAVYEDRSLFGAAMAAGDYDADGFADLAIGAPGDYFIGQVDVGSVRVLFGSALGLTTGGDPYLLGPEADAEQGAALAAGDLDGDGDDDLAIGIPGRTVGGDAGAGAVAIRLGNGGSFLDGGEWSQDTAGVQGVAQPGDQFGAALAAGDFDGDGRDDVAIGVPGEDFDELDEGTLHILFGAPTGVTAARDQQWYRDLLPLADPSPGNESDFFAGALASGDFDGTGHADLAIGSSGEALTTLDAAGAVFVLYGSLFSDGFESGGSASWSSTTP